MKLRLGQPVHTIDGSFGEVADIIVEPTARTVTHLIVEPHSTHHQARLVPMGLVSVPASDVVELSIDLAHLRSLQRVSECDYVKLSEPIDIGPEWDVGVEQILAIPSSGAGFGIGKHDDHAKVIYDRVPKGMCELRRTSAVCCSDDTVVGTVEGFILDDDHIAGVVVRTGRFARRHFVVVPMGSVTEVRTDRISLDLSRDGFRLLPAFDDVFGAEDPPSATARLRHKAWLATRSLNGPATASLKRRRSNADE